MAAFEEFASYVCTLDFPGHEDSVNALAFSPDGVYLASGGDDGILFVLDPTNGQVIHKLRLGTPVTAIRWHAQRTYELFVGAGDGKVMVVEMDAVSIPLSASSTPHSTRHIQVNISGYFLPRDGKGPVEALECYLTPGLERLVVCAASDVELWTMTIKGGMRASRSEIIILALLT